MSERPPDESRETRSVTVSKHSRAEFQRTVQLVDVTFTCRWCGTTRTIHTYPGHKPNICQGNDGKRSKCQREANAERMRAARKKQRGE
jgi:hypothetical protein